MLGLGASMDVFSACLLTQLPHSSYFSPIPASYEATDNRIGQLSEMETALPEEPVQPSRRTAGGNLRGILVPDQKEPKKRERSKRTRENRERVRNMAQKCCL